MRPVPTVIHLQLAPKKKKPVVPAASLTLVAGLGIEGDHHARPESSRQVLLMAEENCDRFGLAPGEVRENIVTRGIDVQALAPGTRLEIGGALLEVTKDCHPCAFINRVRPGLRAKIGGRRGMFVRVLRSGEVRVGDEVTLLPEEAEGPGRRAGSA
jgi:MOSC domain-containing protein YiiM